uniref:Ig-like domain-containing protein n=1 Tax=Phasianus colchicus TaxID=9054 RepID=A0A669QE11_PHACC
MHRKNHHWTFLLPLSAKLPGRFDNTVIHWYQMKENKPPERLLFFAAGKTTVESGFQGKKYMVDKVSSRNLCILTINDVSPDDAATYYCAYWDPHLDRCSEKIFGSGTKLIVSEKGNSKPENSEILQKEHENQLVYVCLFEKFYPEVARVKWIDEAEKEVTENVVKGDVWKFPNEDKYSVSSWLSVPLENKNKKYVCHLEHESGELLLPTHGKYYILNFLLYLLCLYFLYLMIFYFPVKFQK